MKLFVRHIQRSHFLQVTVTEMGSKPGVTKIKPQNTCGFQRRGVFLLTYPGQLYPEASLAAWLLFRQHKR